MWQLNPGNLCCNYLLFTFMVTCCLVRLHSEFLSSDFCLFPKLPFFFLCIELNKQIWNGDQVIITVFTQAINLQPVYHKNQIFSTKAHKPETLFRHKPTYLLMWFNYMYQINRTLAQFSALIHKIIHIPLFTVLLYLNAILQVNRK